MYAVIRSYTFDKKNAAKINAKISDLFTAKLEKSPGFISYYWVDGGDGSGHSVSIFESRQGAEHSVQQAADFIRKELSDMGMTGPEISQGEVKAHAERTLSMPPGKKAQPEKHAGSSARKH